MRLASFQIKGFKSVVDTGQCKLSPTDNIVVLAGQNEAGKTAVLEALSFFANGPSSDFEKYHKRQGSHDTSVTCSFSLETKDKDHLLESLKDFSGITRFLLEKPLITFTREYRVGVAPELHLAPDYLNDLPSITKNITEAVPAISSEVLVSESGEKGLPSVVVKTQEPITKTVIDEEKTKETRDKISILLLEMVPTISFYSSFKDLLPSEVEVQKLQENNAVQDFQKVFSVDLKRIASITDPRDRKQATEELEKKATDDFNDSWGQTISSIKSDKKYQFSIEIDPSSPKKIIFMIKGQDGLPLYLEQKSQGFRWFSAFHLRLKALKIVAGQSLADNQYKKDIIILIDEPGQNLHDRAQEDVKKILNETADSGIQVIYSTHNPNLIGTNGVEFSRIRLISNDDKIGTKVDNVSQFLTKEGSRDALAPIRTAMGLNSVYSLFDGQNRFNVVVEGITDNYYLDAFKKLFGFEDRIFFLPSCGVDNAKSVVSILIGWGDNYRCVIDDDPAQGRKVYNDLKKSFFEGDDETAQKYIYKFDGHAGIEDVFTQHEYATLVLGRDLTDEEKKLPNSALAKQIGKKEMYGRLFLDKILSDKDSVKLSKGTRTKVSGLYEWLYKAFGIKSFPNITE